MYKQVAAVHMYEHPKSMTIEIVYKSGKSVSFVVYRGNMNNKELLGMGLEKIYKQIEVGDVA